MRSESVARQVRGLFNDLLTVSFKDFDRKVPHGWARQMRYADHDIEAELEARLSGGRA